MQMKWIFFSIAVVLTIFLLVGEKEHGNAQQDGYSNADEKSARRTTSNESNSKELEAFLWGMPKKKAFLVGGKIAQLPIEDSRAPLEEILRKSREDAVYAYRAWILYFRCEKYIPLVNEEDSVERKTLEECRLFVDKLSAHHNELLYMAAESGLSGARIDYFNHAFGDYYPDESLNEDSQKMLAAKEAFSMVMDEAVRGGVDAMLMVSGAYEVGVIVEKNPVIGYAFEYAAHKTGLLKKREEVLKLMERYMTNSQIEEATEKGDLIFKKCCEM